MNVILIWFSRAVQTWRTMSILIALVFYMMPIAILTYRGMSSVGTSLTIAASVMAIGFLKRDSGPPCVSPCRTRNAVLLDQIQFPDLTCQSHLSTRVRRGGL